MKALTIIKFEAALVKLIGPNIKKATVRHLVKID